MGAEWGRGFRVSWKAEARRRQGGPPRGRTRPWAAVVTGGITWASVGLGLDNDKMPSKVSI